MCLLSILTVLVVCKICATQGCTDLGMPQEPVNIRAGKAEIIVYAEVMQIHPWKFQQPPFNSFTAEFRMLCPLKNKDQIISDIEEITMTRQEDPNKYEPLFNVTDMGWAPGRCLNVHVQLERRYFLFIRKFEDEEKDSNGLLISFVPDEVNQQTSVITDTEEHRSALKEFITSECQLPELLTNEEMYEEKWVEDTYDASDYYMESSLPSTKNLKETERTKVSRDSITSVDPTTPKYATTLMTEKYKKKSKTKKSSPKYLKRSHQLKGIKSLQIFPKQTSSACVSQTNTRLLPMLVLLVSCITFKF